MTTMTSEAPAWSVDLVGRPAAVDREITTVTALRGNEVFTDREPGRGRDEGEVVALPVTGEFVHIDAGEAEVARGYWLGLAEQTTRVGDEITVLLLAASIVREVTVRLELVEARRVVSGRATDGERAAMGALLAEARAHRRTRRDHAAWLDRLTEEAHTEADDRDWCGDFDDFMARVGLARRTRDYDLRVEVTATVYLTRNANSGEEAIDALTCEDVREALSCGDIKWEAEPDN